MRYWEHLVSRYDCSNINPPDMGWRKYGNNGTGTGLVALTDIVPGPYGGNAIEFNGTDEYVTSASSTGLLGDTSWTISALVKRSAYAVQVPVAFGSLAPGTIASIVLDNNGNGSLRLECGGNVGAYSAAGVVGLDRWYHLIVSKSPGAVSVSSLLYVDGQPIAIAGSAGAATSLAAGSVKIGAYVNNSLYFGGQIADVRIYSSTMLPIQAADLYARLQRGAA